ncbi:polynucleotide adenylyltransferase [Opitutaceae bacterium]|nr:polynucleotide adenylyltransferase [Opitutaceae bacterium]
MIDLPPKLPAVLEAVRAIGRPRLVGGCVRDALLGCPSGDIDIEVGETTFDALLAVLAPFGSTDVVGRSFGTIKLNLHGTSYDFSLPRRESKTGSGHRGFKIAPDPHLSDEDAASRRDFTINAISWDPFAQSMIDPFDGAADLRRKVLRHTSPAFVEDPLRVLRAMQLAARLDFELAPPTTELCRSIAADYATLPQERIWGEWQKWATKSTQPSQGLKVLEQTGWIEHFPEIEALRGVQQEPEWHPEGDVFVHTAHCLDALVVDPDWIDSDAERRQNLMFAVLAHDFGKPATTERVEKHGRMRWTSPRHAVAGLETTATFLQRIGAPSRIAPIVKPLVQFHLAHHDSGQTEPSDAQIRRLSRKLEPASIEDLLAVMRADCHGRPPREDPETITRIALIGEKAAELAVAARAPSPLLQGRHLIDAQLSPGPDFSKILAAAYDAQINGDFADTTSALDWLDSHLKNRPN